MEVSPFLTTATLFGAMVLVALLLKLMIPAAPKMIGPAPPSVPPRSPAIVTHHASVLFPFGSSELSIEARLSLDNLADGLKGQNVRTIRFTGHTDRIGGPAANQTLSDQRAMNVHGYVKQMGIAVDHQQSQGVGSSEPAPDTARCLGDAATASLKACLARDRRVDIEYTAVSNDGDARAGHQQGAANDHLNRQSH